MPIEVKDGVSVRVILEVYGIRDKENISQNVFVVMKK